MSRKPGVYRILLRVLEAVPLPVLAALFEFLALCVWALDRKHRRIARINLRIAFPELEDREASRIVRRSYLRLGTSAAEFVRIPRMDRATFERRIRLEGVDRVVSLTEERGIAPLLLTGHVGNWELLAQAAVLLPVRVAFLVRPLRDPALDALVLERRERAGNRAITKTDSAREVIRQLRNGTPVGILMDQSVDPRHGVLVDFFGKPAFTTDGLARIALAARAPVVPAFIYRDPRRKFHHTIRVGAPLPMDPEAPRDAEVLRLTRACNEALEEAIRRDPAQWLWMQRRWRTRRAGDPDPYEEA